MTLPDWVAAEPGPPQWSARERALIINRYADAAALLRHPGVRVAELTTNIAQLAERAGRSFPNLIDLLGGVLFFRNPPIQTKLRRFLRLTLGLFAPALDAPAIRAHAESVLDTTPRDEPIDAITALANRLPTRVMAGALGLPEAFVAGMRTTSNRLVEAWHYGAPLRVFEGLETEARDLSEMLTQQMGEGLDRTSGLGAMAALGKDQFRLAESEIAASAFFLIWAGTETTAALLGTSIYLMAAYPAERDRWRGGSRATKSYLDEVMRFAGPLRRLNARLAGPGLRLSDVPIDSGTRLLAMIEQAHRDPAAYPDPTRFDPARRGPPHLGFSGGPHTCLGGVLAYREATVLIDALFRRFDVELPDRVPHWEDHPDLRRLERLEVILRPAENCRR
jgi:cytochrome P450